MKKLFIEIIKSIKEIILVSVWDVLLWIKKIKNNH